MDNINEMEIILQLQFIGFVTDCVTIIKTLTKYQAPFTHELISTVLKYVQNDCKRRLRVTLLLGRTNLYKKKKGGNM